MKFGLFLEWPNPTLRNWKTLFEEGVQQVQYSEEMGFDYCLIAEHHFTNYGNSPAPLMQALYIGRRTRHIKIGTASVILPVWHPLRLAEEIAVLDNLIDGRLMCGIGRGYQGYEMAGFGSELGESRTKFQETFEVLLKAWTSDESFTYDGEYVRIENPITVFPKPMQKPHPPLWISGTSVESMQLAAQHDMLPLSSSNLGMDGVKRQLGSYLQARKAAGKPLGIAADGSPSLALQCMTHVAPTDEEALEALPYVRWQTRAQRGLNRHDVTNGKADASPFDGELDDDAFLDRLYFGSPETVIQKFRRAADAGATHISNWMMFGGIEHEKLMRSVRLMGEEVLPALRDYHPPASLYSDLLKQQPVTTEELQRARFAPGSTQR